MLLHNGMEIAGYDELSCANQEFALASRFSCLRCDAGMLPDRTQPAGCRVAAPSERPRPSPSPSPSPSEPLHTGPIHGH